MKNQDALFDAVKAAPPVGVAGMSVFGMPLSDAVLALTALYTVFLIIDKLPTVLTRIVEMYRWLKGDR